MGTQSNKREQQKFVWISNSLHPWVGKNKFTVLKRDCIVFTHSTNDSQITKSLKDSLKRILSLTPIAMSFERS